MGLIYVAPTFLFQALRKFPKLFSCSVWLPGSSLPAAFLLKETFRQRICAQLCWRLQVSECRAATSSEACAGRMGAQ